MDRTLEILHRARAWVTHDVRVRAALVHGSVVQGTITPLSDVDLIVVAEPGARDDLWAERESITRRLLGAPAAVAESPLRLPYRWQARTADLDMLDLTIDEESVRVWNGFTGPVEFLVDRADVGEQFHQAMARQVPPPPHDAAAGCDATWGLIATVTGLLLHNRTLTARIRLNELITSRLVPLLDRPAYSIGTWDDDHDRELTARLDQTFPSSTATAELGRAVRAAADWYSELLTGWAERIGQPRPTSQLEPGVIAALERLTELDRGTVAAPPSGQDHENRARR